MTAKEYQRKIKSALSAIFPPDMIKLEWNTRLGASDGFSQRGVYAPRADVAVGPFNISPDGAGHARLRIETAGRHRFVRALIRLAKRQNGEAFALNRNPRCLLSIEVESRVSSKHILGGITNASMLGFVGVVIGHQLSVEKVQRIAGYTRLIRAVAKAPSSLFTNVVCLSSNDFLSLLQDDSWADD